MVLRWLHRHRETIARWTGLYLVPRPSLALLLIVIVGLVLIGVFAARNRPAEPLDFHRMEASAFPNAWLVCPADFCLGSFADNPFSRRLSIDSDPGWLLTACPPDLCTGPNRFSAIYSVSREELRSAWETIVSMKSRVDLVRRDEDGFGGTWVEKSEIFGFRDRINVRFFSLPDGRSTLAVHSRSEVGVYDFGVNRRRVERWLAELEKLEWQFNFQPSTELPPATILILP